MVQLFGLPGETVKNWRVKAPGTFDTELAREFFQAFAMNAGVTLHIANHYGANSHHIAETCFKAVARVLRGACQIDPRQADLRRRRATTPRAPRPAIRNGALPSPTTKSATGGGRTSM